jgi:hypothetical protein
MLPQERCPRSGVYYVSQEWRVSRVTRSGDFVTLAAVPDVNTDIFGTQSQGPDIVYGRHGVQVRGSRTSSGARRSVGVRKGVSRAWVPLGLPTADPAEHVGAVAADWSTPLWAWIAHARSVSSVRADGAGCNAPFLDLMRDMGSRRGRSLLSNAPNKVSLPEGCSTHPRVDGGEAIVIVRTCSPLARALIRNSGVRVTAA